MTFWNLTSRRLGHAVRQQPVHWAASVRSRSFPLRSASSATQLARSRSPWCSPPSKSPRCPRFSTSAARSKETHAAAASWSLTDDSLRLTITESSDRTGLLLSYPAHNGTTTSRQISWAWLLDTDQSTSSIHQSTSQKFFHSSDAIDAIQRASSVLASPPQLSQIPETGEVILSLTLDSSVKRSNAFSQTFCNASSPSSASEPVQIHIPTRLLLSHVDERSYDEWHDDVLGVARPWTAEDLSAQSGPLQVAWTDIAAADLEAQIGSTMLPLPSVQEPKRLESLYALVTALLQDGLAFTSEVPTSTTASTPFEASQPVASLYNLARHLGEIRATFYGPLLWDVRSMRKSLNVAYTNSDLGFHADLCYFANPPRFQLLHMLKNQVKGGKSLFVDGFAVAHEMWKNHRNEFIALATTPVAFHYDNDGRYYRFAHPTIELAQPFEGFAGSATSIYPSHPAGTTPAPASLSNAEELAMPRLAAINYSPPFQAPLPLYPSPLFPDEPHRGGDSELHRAALSTFARLTHEARFTYQRQMRQGECAVFDNRRVLHSRTGFEWDEAQEQTVDQKAKPVVKRWLKGCYVEGDAVWSSFRVLHRRLAASQSKA